LIEKREHAAVAVEQHLRIRIIDRQGRLRELDRRAAKEELLEHGRGEKHEAKGGSPEVNHCQGLPVPPELVGSLAI
jgi:hypothetical protein